MDRIHDILNSVNETLANAAQKTYKGQKRSELKDSDFLFPETRSFPIVSPQDVPDAISNFGRMKGQMSYDAFLKKLYNMAKRKGPEFVAALPKASKEQLGLKKNVKAQEENENESPEMEMEEYKQDFYEMSVASIRAIATHAAEILNNLENPMVKENLTESWLQGRIAITEDYMRTIHDYIMYTKEEASKADSYNDINQFEMGPSTMKNLDDLYGDDEENTPLNNTNAMLYHITGIGKCMSSMSEKITDQSVHSRLTNAGWHDKIAAMYHSSCQMQDFVMNAPLADDDKTMVAKEVDSDQVQTDLPIDTKSGNRPGLWDNIRKKKEREGKNYKPAKPGDKDRPDPEQWKKLSK
jgi:hypothetical protein